jgi:hypothetical protein
VVANVRWIVEQRKARALPIRLLASCVLTRATEGERDLHKSLFGPILDDILYINAGPQAGQSIAAATLVTPSYNKIEFPPEGSLEPCFMLWKRAHLTSEGYLTLCCVDYENNLTYAKVDDGRPLLEHWHNSVITEMRKKHIAQDLHGTLCQRCYYGGDEPYAPISELGREKKGEPSPKKAKWLKERIESMAPKDKK